MTTTNSDRYVVISGDSHDGPPSYPEKYKPYIPSRLHEEFDKAMSSPTDFLAMAMFGIPLTGSRDWDPEPFRNYSMDMLALTRGRSRDWLQEMVDRYWPDGEPPGMLDPHERIAGQETQGIVGEVIYTIPSAGTGAVSPELRRAVEVAGMRWLEDYCNAVPGRLAGVITLNWEDLDRSIADIREARKAGLFGGVHLPTPRTQIGGRRPHMTEGLPPLVDPHWEPLWAVCAELDLPLLAHMGMHRGPAELEYGTDRQTAGALDLFEISWSNKRQFLHIMSARVFDRYPKLKLGFLETPVSMIPGLLHEADSLFQDNGSQLGLKRLPSEYWYENCFVATPFMDAHDARNARYEIGIGNLCFGSDFPQHEGTWPITTPSLRHALGGLPEAEIRAILGGNAARIWGFDLKQLQKVADRCGPTVEELSTPLPASEIPPYHPGGRWSPYRLRGSATAASK